MNKQPLLPKQEKYWSKEANDYRVFLHNTLFPKAQVWNPSMGGVTAGSTEASYTTMGGVTVFSVAFQGPTTASVGAYIDLPFEVSQYSVFSVAVSGSMLPAVVDKGSSRLYLPSWPSSGRVIISGTAIS
jgi:hypothetical protein